MKSKASLRPSQSANFAEHSTGIRLRTLVAAGLVCFAASQAALAQDIPRIACDNRVYISHGFDSTQLQVRTRGEQAGNFVNVGPPGTPYNAMGINPSGYLYAVAVDTDHLLQINPANGEATNLGAVADLPGSGSRYYNAGTFDTDGNFYVKLSGPNDELYVIDVETQSATLLPLTSSFPTADLAWVEGKLYALNRLGQLRSIDITTGEVSVIGDPFTPAFPFRMFESLFGFSDGLFGAADDGGYYQIDLVTGVQTRISESPANNLSDGANCPAAAFVPSLNAPVPTLGEWSLALLAGLMGLAGIAGVRRRRTR